MIDRTYVLTWRNLKSSSSFHSKRKSLFVLRLNRCNLTSLRKKSPTSKREGAPAPVKVGDEFRLALANE
ncbi:hypothetical protein ABEO92_08085, partial [Geobacillus stearothermophilus]|uniref:hypothetical protein n=1 Tax=Geobacillus stearothermophilus TaxID=1422 RepID=UPI003D255D7F